jgi:hypothetical protein
LVISSVVTVAPVASVVVVELATLAEGVTAVAGTELSEADGAGADWAVTSVPLSESGVGAAKAAPAIEEAAAATSKALINMAKTSW